MNSKNIKIGAIYSLLTSWTVKLLGLASSIILARTLPADAFGLSTLLMMILFFFELFSTVGSKPYLLTLDKINNTDLNSSFTLRLLLRLSLVIVVLISSQTIMEFFNQPNFSLHLKVASLMLLFSALENPLLIDLTKKLQYNVLFKISLYAKISSFVVTISIALLYRNEWALILGAVFSSLITTFFSYVLAPYVPRIEFSGIKNQWKFTKWIFFGSFINYARAKADTFFLSKTSSLEIIGLFSIAKEIAMLIYEQFAVPLNDILVSQNAGLNKDQLLESIYSKFSKYILFLSGIVGIAFSFSQEIIHVLLGVKWTSAIPIFETLTFSAFFLSLSAFNYAILNAIGEVKRRFYFDILNSVIAIILLYFSSQKELSYFCYTIVITNIIYFGLTFFQLYNRINFCIKRFLFLPLFCCIPAIICTVIFSSLPHTTFLSFVCQIPIFIMLLLCLNFSIFYLLRSYPEYTELLDYISTKIKSQKTR